MCTFAHRGRGKHPKLHLESLTVIILSQIAKRITALSCLNVFHIIAEAEEMETADDDIENLALDAD